MKLARSVGLPSNATKREVIAAGRALLAQMDSTANAWAAAEAAERQRMIELRFGVLVALRDGAIAVARRADRMPPGAFRVSREKAHEFLTKGVSLHVIGIHGTRSPPLHPDTWRRLAGPLFG